MLFADDSGEGPGLYVPGPSSAVAQIRLSPSRLACKPDGAVLARVDAAAAARGAVDHVLDASQRWTDHLSGFYDVDGVRRLPSRSGRPVSKQAVSERRGLLALTTGSGCVVYPTSHFSGG